MNENTILNKIQQAEGNGITSLLLSYEQLSQLPPEIGQLTNLVSLDLSFNQLSQLPPEIGQLTNLISLDLSSNKLSQLPPEIGQLTNLNTLYLSSNQLDQLLPEIGQLTNLKKLNLSSNQLCQLPLALGQLTKLNTLLLSFNQLSQLSPEIGQLINLKELDLHNNLLPIPPEILSNIYDPKIILDYWKESISAPNKPLNEAKMLIVGQGGVGKTSLVKRLIDNDFNPSEGKTDGINIHDWNVRVKESSIKLNVWDFGGQEIMHATHQFFLTKRSLYLVVVDSRQGEDENRLEYWLKIINSFSDNSPTIIVGNKTDQAPLDLDRRGLVGKYPQIKAFIETSCASGEGIERLKVAILTEIAQLDHVFDPLPIRWFDIKRQLENLKKIIFPMRLIKNYANSKV